MQQPELLETINDHIKRVLSIALEHGLLDDDLAKRVRMNNKVPYRKLQCLILTSEAFFAMSHNDAADAMGVSVDYIAHALMELRQQFPSLAQFERLWTSNDRRGSIEKPYSWDSMVRRNASYDNPEHTHESTEPVIVELF